MNFYKRRWDEDRGDEYADWGGSDWYFETMPDGAISRQMEVYDNGRVLKYDETHNVDAYGMLGDQPLDVREFEPFAISQDAFFAAWAGHNAMNLE